MFGLLTHKYANSIISHRRLAKWQNGTYEIIQYPNDPLLLTQKPKQERKQSQANRIGRPVLQIIVRLR